MKLIVGKNDLATTHPELVKEAHGWDPTTVVAGTHKKLQWKCSHRHTWETTGKHRIRGQGCPVCSNKQVLVGYNDLATTNPDLAKEAFGWDPTAVVAGTHKKLQWQCSKGHIWKALGSKRIKGTGCPICDNKQVLVGYNDLATTHPELAGQANGWDPSTVIAGTNKILQWKCSEGHTWKAQGNDRSQGSGCPVCSNKQVLVGYNDLATTNPDLAKEADGWDPTTVIAGTNKKLQWKCSKGHVWIAPGDRRSLGSGCPVCDNKKVLVGYNDLATTHPELAKEADGWDPKTVTAGTNKKLQWKCLQGHKWDASGNTRVTGVGCPVCSNQKLLIGYNDLATTHPELAKEADGWDPKTVIAGTHKKLQWKCKKNHIWSAPGSGRKLGDGCPVCDNKKVLVGYNDLATTHPELTKEADGWDPKTVIRGTHKRLNWKCKNGHIWIATAHSRRNCPVCSNQKLLVGYNDLATTHPELAREADGWDPKTVIAGTHKTLKWKCTKGHAWRAPGSGRARGIGCPVCSNQKLLIGYNDLETTHPELAKEADGWDPKTVIAGTAKKLSWKCSEGHKWQTPGSVRTNGSNCPSCATSGFNPSQNAFVYFLIQPNWEVYQIGITNEPEDRLKKHKRNNFDLLELRGPMDGHTAQELETALLRYLKSQKADLSPEHIAGKFDGYSESWTIDSFKVNNLKELIDKATEAGF